MSSRAQLLFRAAIIFVVGFWIYWPALHGDWLWDDNIDITSNPITQSPTGLWSIWFEPSTQPDYYPVKTSLQWLQWQLWGGDTLGYHVTNVLLHLLSTMLVWRLFHKLRLRLAWLGAMIFAVHPIMVESVAWIAELKNTLSLPLFLAAMLCYLDYEERGKRSDYVLAAGLFLLAMLTKPAMVMFPFVILLHAWWKRGRIGRQDLKACASFFAISLAVGLMTLWISHRALEEQPVVLGGWLSRTACAGLAIAFYFSKSVLPLNLMTIYPRWDIDPPQAWQFLPWLVLVGVLYFFWIRRADWGRPALFGVGFFLINLLPFLGFNAIAYMAYTWVMDHFLYLPIIGLIGLAVAGLEKLQERLPLVLCRMGTGFVAMILLLLAWSSHGYAKLYVNGETQWRATLELNPNAAIAHHNLGAILAGKGQIPEAIGQIRQAIQLYPGYSTAHHNLATLLLHAGQPREAMAELETVAQLMPNDPDAHFNLAVVMDEVGEIPQAIEQYRLVLNLAPNYIPSYVNLANDLARQHRLDLAIQVMQLAAQIDPNNADVQKDLAYLIQRQKQALESK